MPNIRSAVAIASATTAIGLALGVLPPVPAVAAPRIHTVNTVKELSCGFATTGGDFVSFQASSNSQDATVGSAFFVEHPDETILLKGSAGTASFGPRFAASVDAVVPSTGQQTGTATLTADVAESTPQVEQVDERDGNIRTTGTITSTEYAFTNVAARVPGFTLVPGEGSGSCSGSTLVFDLYTTNPPVKIVTTRSFNSDTCTVTGVADAKVRLSGETRRAPFAELVIDDGANPLKAQGDVVMTGRRGSLDAPLVDYYSDRTVADLHLALVLTRTRRPSTTVEREGKTITVTTATPYRAQVSITTSDRRRGSVSCPAIQRVETELTFRP